MPKTKATPMMRQYLSIKEEYPDAILFYRMGDFYEMFYEDAELAAGLLEITLTSRNKNDKSPIPMCGVPYRAVKSYIAKLIDLGHKVAICDQVENPAEAKGLVKREVVRVVTPGMIVETELLDDKSHNYLLAVAVAGNVTGLASLDISTGTFRVTESRDAIALVEEAQRIGPNEILMPQSGIENDAFESYRQVFIEKTITPMADREFELGTAKKRLCDLFNTVSLEGFGCEQLPAAIRAAGAIVAYVGDTQKQTVEHISSIETYHLGTYLWVDQQSCRNLELLENIRSGSRQDTLVAVIDKTVTAMGGRLLKQWIRYPLRDQAAIEKRLDAVAEAKADLNRTGSLRLHLKQVADLERLGSKITMGHANGRDLLALRQSLACLPVIQSELVDFRTGAFHWDLDLGTLKALADHIEAAIREDAPLTIQEGGLIREGYDAELDELIGISRDGKGWLVRLEASEKEATGIGSLKVRFNKVFGYYIEVSKAQSESVPEHYVRKQTLVNAERYITDELKAFEAKVLGAEERRAAMEYEIFNRLRAEVVAQNALILEAAAFVAQLDCLLNLALVAEENEYTRPRLNTDGVIRIDDGRHPVIEKVITGERFVPNSVYMDNESAQILMITGPNMAGKSTILRQTALTVLMAQFGSFVPAEKADIALTDRIFTRVGALDNLASGQSTFLVEMQETANILNHATSDSLVILDEIGRGTSTYDGLSIAWAVAVYLHDLNQTGVKTLFATHYHELTDLAQSKVRIKNFNVAVKEWNDEIIFLRKLAEGGTNRSYGIQVARLAGVPEGVIADAKKVLATIERGEFGDTLQVAGSAKDDAPMQMSLFRSPEARLIDRLREVNVEQMTPIEAIGVLDALKRRADEI